MKIALIAKDNQLYFPMGGSDSMNGEWDCPELPSLLICHYDEGDRDTCPWPMKSDFVTKDQLQQRLAQALYDERESNACWPHDVPVVILLPNGDRFDFDSILAEEPEGHQREYNPDNYRGF